MIKRILLFNCRLIRSLPAIKQYIFFIGCAAIVLSCNGPAQWDIREEQRALAVGMVNKDSIAPPVVKPLGAPRIIPANDPKKVPLKYPFGIGRPAIINYGVGDGLPQNLIIDVAVDKQGNLWCGGLGFLSKYDGSKFTNYTMANGMGSSFVNKILVDDDNNIWVCNYDGLYKFDGQAFQTTALSDLGVSRDLRGLCIDKKGVVWVASFQGVFRMEGDSLSNYDQQNGLPDKTIWNIYTNADDQILVSTSSGVYIKEGDRFVPFASVPNLDGNAAFIVGKDRNNNLWFTRRRNRNENLDLIHYDGKEVKVYSSEDGLNVPGSFTNIKEDRNGIIWIHSFDKGLIRFDGNRFVYYNTNDGLPTNAVYTSAEDDVGNIWVATTNGLSCLSYGFMNHLETVGSEESFNTLFVPGNNGSRWGLEGGSISPALINYYENFALVYDLSELKVTTSFQDLFMDESGDIWMTVWSNSQPGKLIHFDRRNFYEYGEDEGITISQFRKIKTDSRGNLWLTGSGGALMLDGKSVTQYGTAQGFPATISCFFIDSKGHYWMVDADTAVCKYDGSFVTRYALDNALKFNGVNAIAEDPFGNIWLASDQGAIRFAGDTVAKYGPSEGLDNLVAGIAVDTSRRMIWFSTITGLISLPFDQIDSSHFEVQKFSQRNGFSVINSHVQYNQTYFDAFGLWGASYNGIYRFDYDKVKQLKEPLLQISNIRVNNKEVVWASLMHDNAHGRDSLIMLNESVLKLGKPQAASIRHEQATQFGHIAFDSLQKGTLLPESLRLPYSNNSITFEFTNLSPSFGKYTQYRYRLTGYENNWSPYSTKQEAFFGNMQEGEYTFQLQAISSTGGRSELMYSFRVLPPWYRAWWAYVLYALLIMYGIYTFIRWRTKALQREKLVLEQKVNKRTNELKESLDSLKATQSQLVQSEKMASLGELTAGIAHEIQNPLNFVNNFSEINDELIGEMVDELKAGNTAEALAIADAVRNNAQKISEHGKRAGSIVRSMLEHSRKSDGQKEATDINQLADECLRLAYHGMRAKNPLFHSDYETELDMALPLIPVVSQDIGRVLLNLISNAFYAVNAKAEKAGIDYKPLVKVTTTLKNDAVVISVVDNGTGIREEIKDKIFQPFFTTKPTGSGTGLGLSLSYDIIKAHGGELTMESAAGVGTTFSILLKG